MPRLNRHYFNEHDRALAKVVEVLRNTPSKLLTALDNGQAYLTIPEDTYRELGLAPGRSLLNRGQTVPNSKGITAIMIALESK